MNSQSMPSPNIFLSHASEDKRQVLQVYANLATHAPDIVPWIDTFEIVGGDSLIEKISAGMDEAEKFFIFLTPTSVTKPWVRAELRRALNQEISGVKPQYIVPVKSGGLTKVPAFLEDRRYIDLDVLTLPEWVAEFKAAIAGEIYDKEVPAAENLQVTTLEHPNPELRHIGQVAFTVAAWAEEASFAMRTRTPAHRISCHWDGPGVIAGGARNYAEMLHPDRVGYALPGRRLGPGQILRITVEFPEGTDFKSSIYDISRWDGTASTTNGISF